MTFTADLCRRHRAWAVDQTRFDEVPPGWHELVERLFEAIATVMAEHPGRRLAVRQVKEAFGGLRVYLGPAGEDEDARAPVPDAVRRLVVEAERRSFLVCDRCGAPGRARAGADLYATRCDGCAKPGSAPIPDPDSEDAEGIDTDAIETDPAVVLSTLLAEGDEQAVARQRTGSVWPRPHGSRQPPAVASAATTPSDDGFDGDDLDLDEGNEPQDDAASDALVRALVPGHCLMDRVAIEAALNASGSDGTSFDHLSSGEEQRVRTLVLYRDSSLFRPHLIGSPAMLARLDDLDRAAPNFGAVSRLVCRAATLSQVAGAPLRVQPLVLLGSPGIGKSRYAKALAAALGTSCHNVSGATLPDVGSLTGYPPAWRGAGPGRIAKFLITAATSGPVIFVDEAEKIVDFERMAHPLDRLLPLLEYGTAQAYQDENLHVPMRAQHAIVVFAVNSLDGLSEPFRDRVLTLRVPDLTAAQREAVLQAMLAEVGRDLGLAVSLAGPEALAPLRGLSTRRCRLALEIAVAHAVEDERRFLLAADLAEAVALLGRPDARQAVGFLSHPATPRD